MVQEEEIATRVLLTGAAGLLGQATQRLWSKTATVDARTHAQLDVTDAAALASALDESRPDVVVQAAAYNRVDLAESDREEAERVNHGANRDLARLCAERNILLVAVSTDYVFDGALRRPYTEEDATAPLSHYGRTKLRGEEAVRAAGGEHLIIRTQALYGEARRTIVNRVLEGGEIQMARDRVSQPTSAADLAAGILRLVEAGARGLFNVANQGPVSWYEFALMVREMSGRTDGRVTPVDAGARGEAADRPAYSALSSARCDAAVGEPMRPVRDALRDFLAGMTQA